MTAKTIAADVTIRFRFDNICGSDDLEDTTLREMVVNLLVSEGLSGIVDNDGYRVVEVVRVFA